MTKEVELRVSEWLNLFDDEDLIGSFLSLKKRMEMTEKQFQLIFSITKWNDHGQLLSR